MKKVMFVCTGNICRSAVAKKYMEYKLNKMNMQDEFYVDSCGTHATDGRIVANTTVQIMNEYGLDISYHKAKNMSNVDFNKYDIILTMTNEQKLIVLNLHRNIKNKIFTLKEFVDNDYSEYIDIDDPWGLDFDVHRYIYKEIMKYIDKLIDKIKDVKL